jgi:hypothetical protein
LKISGWRILASAKGRLDRGQELTVPILGSIGVQKEQTGVGGLRNLPQHKSRKDDAPGKAKNVWIVSAQEKLATGIPADPG